MKGKVPDGGRCMDVTVTRREMLTAFGVLGLGGVAAACSKGQNPPHPAPSGSIAALKEGASSITVIGPPTQINPGEQTFTFFLATKDGVVEGATVQVWLAKDEQSEAAGPFPAQWYPLRGYDETKDMSPRSPVAVGVYSVDVDFSSPGIWTVAGVVESSSGRAVGTQAVPVVDSKVIAALGSKALSVATPVATTDHALREICTRNPPDRMHYISLDNALRNGRPTVVSFATPLLCESQMCGPTVDEQILVFEGYGKGQANFIHVEEFLPGADLKPPPATVRNLSPAFKKWGFMDEPWVIVIDAHGVVTGRLGPGATAAPQIEAALQPLL
jgi:hypothetical protein